MSKKKTKICSKCKKEKPREDFPKNSRRKDGLDYTCKLCRTKAQRKYRQSETGKAARKKAYQKYRNSPNGKKAIRKNNTKYKKTNRLRVNALQSKRRLERMFGGTHLQYNVMLKQQNGGCAICGGINANGTRLAIDHCHKTGKNRGLLCGRCNLALGGFYDDVNILASAIKYLSRGT